jgi:PST family polysaccharide transporter
LLPLGIAIGAGGTILSPTLSANPRYGVLATLLGLMSAMNLGWFFQGLRRFRTSIMLEASAYPLNILFILFLVRNQEDGVFALAGLVLSSFICTVSAYGVSLKYIDVKTCKIRGGVKEIKSASVIFIQSINSMIMTSGSTYLLSVLSTAEQVGYFGAVERLISFALAMLGPAGQVLMPTIAHRAAHAPDQVGKLVRDGLLVEICFGAVACLGGFVIAPYFIPLMFGDQFDSSIRLFRILVFALPFAAFTHAFGLYVLVPRKRERVLVTAVTFGNGLSLLLIVLLTSRLGALGVSYSRLAGEGLTAGILILMALRRRGESAGSLFRQVAS